MSDVVPLRPLRDPAPGLVETPTVQTIEIILDACRIEGEMGAVRGGVGVGKTATARRYAARHDGVVVSTMRPKAPGLDYIRANVVAALADIGGDYYGRDGYFGSARYQIRDDLARLLRNVGLLILDEANHADWALLGFWRGLFDDAQERGSPFGLVFLGNPALFRKKGDWSQADAVRSRCAYWHEIERPGDDDVLMVLDAWQIRGVQARSFLAEIAGSGQGLRKMVQVIGRAHDLGGGQKPSVAVLADAAAQCGWMPRR